MKPGTRWAVIHPLVGADYWDTLEPETQEALVSATVANAEHLAERQGLTVAWDTTTVERQAVGFTLDPEDYPDLTEPVYMPPMVAVRREGTVVAPDTPAGSGE